MGQEIEVYASKCVLPAKGSGMEIVLRKYDLVIFDMDGTILNTLDDLTDSLNVVLLAHHYPQRTLAEVRSFVGNGIRLLIERAVPEGLSVEEIDQIHQDFMNYYEEHCADKTKPYQGVPALIKTLREQGYRTAVVSNKADQAVQELCQQYFPGLFDIAVGERPGIAKKPAPDSVNQVLQSLNMKREQAVYVGDSEVDVATAYNAGMDGIAVTWGFRKPDFLKQQGATCLVSDPKEIIDLV
ncbi:MAG: HAD-IIIA family hydrolase [Eubacteriales bacterium]|nr:HAD-IIIA family hydrolase [Eubacteriales bacterium]